jgi:hypothetical protein
MPAPGTTTANTGRHAEAQARVLAAFFGDDQKPATKADIQALRDDIADLVALLKPPSAVIITGAEAARAFQALRGADLTGSFRCGGPAAS